MKQLVFTVVTSFLLLVVLGFGTTARAELPVITGENRAATDNDSKRAFLMGIATSAMRENRCRCYSRW